jgi:transcriptional regulator with XRE-family HTH domain
MPKKHAIADLLRAKRRLYGWSQEKVAEKLDMSQQQYRKYEAGLLIPPIPTLEKLSKLFQISICDFFNDDAKVYKTVQDFEALLKDEAGRALVDLPEVKQIIKTYAKNKEKLKDIDIAALLSKIAKSTKTKEAIKVFVLNK